MHDVRLIDATRLHAQVFNDNGGDLSKTENVAQILLRIENATTIDAQPAKRGKWIIYSLYVQCSECSVAYDFDTFQRLIPMNEKFPRHCSYCGAYMKGDADGNQV